MPDFPLKIEAACGASTNVSENQKRPHVVNPNYPCAWCRYQLVNGQFVLVNHNPLRDCIFAPNAPIGDVKHRHKPV